MVNIFISWFHLTILFPFYFKWHLFSGNNIHFDTFFDTLKLLFQNIFAIDVYMCSVYMTSGVMFLDRFKLNTECQMSVLIKTIISITDCERFLLLLSVDSFCLWFTDFRDSVGSQSIDFEKLLAVIFWAFFMPTSFLLLTQVHGYFSIIYYVKQHADILCLFCLASFNTTLLIVSVSKTIYFFPFVVYDLQLTWSNEFFLLT